MIIPTKTSQTLSILMLHKLQTKKNKITCSQKIFQLEEIHKRNLQIAILSPILSCFINDKTLLRTDLKQATSANHQTHPTNPPTCLIKILHSPLYSATTTNPALLPPDSNSSTKKILVFSVTPPPRLSMQRTMALEANRTTWDSKHIRSKSTPSSQLTRFVLTRTSQSARNPVTLRLNEKTSMSTRIMVKILMNIKESQSSSITLMSV